MNNCIDYELLLFNTNEKLSIAVPREVEKYIFFPQRSVSPVSIRAYGGIEYDLSDDPSVDVTYAWSHEAEHPLT